MPADCRLCVRHGFNKLHFRQRGGTECGDGEKHMSAGLPAMPQGPSLPVPIPAISKVSAIIQAGLPATRQGRSKEPIMAISQVSAIIQAGLLAIRQGRSIKGPPITAASQALGSIRAGLPAPRRGFSTPVPITALFRAPTERAGSPAVPRVRRGRSKTAEITAR